MSKAFTKIELFHRSSWSTKLVKANGNWLKWKLKWRLVMSLYTVFTVTMCLPQSARADAGIPMLVVVWPISWLLLLIIIPLEAIIAKSILSLSKWRCFWLSVAANSASTLLGIPLTWVILAIGEMLVAFLGRQLGWLNGSINHGWKLLSFIILSSPWLAPNPGYDSSASSEWQWILPTSLISLCIPFFFASLWCEYLVAKRFVQDKVQAYRWALIANSASYGVILTVLLAGLVWAMWIHAHEEFGYIDLNGKMILRPQVNEHHCFSEGLAAAAVGDRWGFLNKSGEFAITPRFRGVGSFVDGLAPAENDLGKWGFINRSGIFVIKPVFDDVLNFSESIATVMENKSCFFIDKTGKKIIEQQFKYATSFSNGLAIVLNDYHNFKGYYINKQGKLVFPVCGHVWSFMNRSWHCPAEGYIGKFRHRPTDSPLQQGLFSEGLAGCFDDNGTKKWGYINTKNEIVIPPRFTGISPFQEDMAYVFTQDQASRCEFINRSGRTIFSLNDYPISGFANGLALISAADDQTNLSRPHFKQFKCYFMNKSGKNIFGRTFDHAEPFSEGLAAVGEKWLIEH